MLPLPTPFKLFVLAAAVAEMRFTHFLAAIFAGRFIRFLILGALTIRFGPQFVHLAGDIIRHHYLWVTLVALLGFATWWLLRRNRRSSESALEPGGHSADAGKN